jgi:hypothetical protein
MRSLNRSPRAVALGGGKGVLLEALNISNCGRLTIIDGFRCAIPAVKDVTSRGAGGRFCLYNLI